MRRFVLALLLVGCTNAVVAPPPADTTCGPVADRMAQTCFVEGVEIATGPTTPDRHVDELVCPDGHGTQWRFVENDVAVHERSELNEALHHDLLCIVDHGTVTYRREGGT